MPSLDDVDWPIRTERLTIRRQRADDSPALFAIRNQAEVSQWITSWRRDAQAYAEQLTDPAFREPNLVVERDGLIVGDAMVRIEDGWAQTEVADQAHGTQAEIGYTMDPAHQGNGYASECVAAIIELCFGRLGLRRLTASAFADNFGSRKVLERNGFRLEQYGVKDSLHRDLGWIDGVAYALLADEWRDGSNRRADDAQRAY